MKTKEWMRCFGFKIAAVLLITAGLGLSLTGCHSGTMRGAGSDLEEIGENMQK